MYLCATSKREGTAEKKGDTRVPIREPLTNYGRVNAELSAYFYQSAPSDQNTFICSETYGIKQCAQDNKVSVTLACFNDSDRLINHMIYLY